MRRVVLLGVAVGLGACTLNAESAIGGFETLNRSLVPDGVCVFGPVDGPADQMVFATYPDNLDHLAVARLKGETIKLVPKTVPDLSSDTFDVTYEIVDYLKWQVRVQSVDGVGSMQVIREGQPTDMTIAMQGSCAG